MPPTLDIKVLSLAGSLDRRARMTKMLEGAGAPSWSFFDAVPATDLPTTYVPEVAYENHGSALSQAEISCAASHLLMLKQFVDSSTSDYLMVLEDDVLFDPHYRFSRSAELMNILEIDYLKLYSRLLAPSKFIRDVGAYVFYRSNWPPLGTQCYVLSKFGAKNLLEAVTSESIKYSIDVAFDRYWDTKTPIVTVYPYPLLELAVPTTIHNPAARQEIENANRELSSRLGRRPTSWHRIKDKIAKRLCDYRLKKFDRDLAARIEAHRDQVFSILYN